MYTVIAKFIVAPENLEQFKTVAAALGAESKKEEGILYYTMHADENAENSYASVEVYQSKEAHAFHASTPHVAEYFPQLTALSSADPVIEFYKEV